MEKIAPIIDNLKESPDKRIRKPNTPWIGIVIHHTNVSARFPLMTDEEKEKHHDNIVNWLTTPDETYVSAHFQISPAGRITQIVNPKTHVAYHAGSSTWFHPLQKKMVSGMNDHMIGIELVGDGNLYPYTENQYRSLADLCVALRILFPEIYPNCIVGHSWVSIGRKVDPGDHFNWHKLYDYMGVIA